MKNRIKCIPVCVHDSYVHGRNERDGERLYLSAMIAAERARK